MKLSFLASEVNSGEYLFKWINYLVEGNLINSKEDNTTIIMTVFFICIFFLIIITMLIVTICEKNKTIKKYINEKNNLIKICQERNKIIKELKDKNYKE